jgi:hypothetical protein
MSRFIQLFWKKLGLIFTFIKAAEKASAELKQTHFAKEAMV